MSDASVSISAKVSEDGGIKFILIDRVPPELTVKKPDFRLSSG